MSNTLEIAAEAATQVGGWAEVRADDHTTRYMRYGAGSAAQIPVVILVPATTDANIWPELFESLWEQQRIYIPDLPNTTARFGDRLRGFLDGLGIARATLIAPGSFGTAAIEFAATDGDRLESLVLVPRGDAEELQFESAFEVPNPNPLLPVLVVRRELSADEAIAQVTEFVARW